jgi:hypothetical protein
MARKKVRVNKIVGAQLSCQGFNRKAVSDSTSANTVYTTVDQGRWDVLVLMVCRFDSAINLLFLRKQRGDKSQGVV